MEDIKIVLGFLTVILVMLIAFVFSIAMIVMA